MLVYSDIEEGTTSLEELVDREVEGVERCYGAAVGGFTSDFYTKCHLGNWRRSFSGRDSVGRDLCG